MADKPLDDKKVRELLEEIQDWMIDNDYECGDWGSDIYNKIAKILGKDSD
jgi:hypothetical protein